MATDSTQRNPNFFSSPELRSLPDTEDSGREDKDEEETSSLEVQASASMVKLQHPADDLPPPAYSQTALQYAVELEEGHCSQR